MTSSEIEDIRRLYQNHWDYYADPKLGFLRMLTEITWTQDEMAKVEEGEEAIKRFPIKEYIRYFNDYVRPEQFIVIPKSRRMMATWLIAAYCVWTLVFKEGRTIVWQSQSAKKSADTLENKMLFIIKHFPTDRVLPFVDYARPSIPHPFTRELCNFYSGTRTSEGLSGITMIRRRRDEDGAVRFEKDSRVLGLAEGADQWRQYTVSLGVGDEFAFWNDPEGSLRGARPSVGDTGQLILISSANPGFMEDIIKPDKKAPLTGLPEHDGIKTYFSEMGYFVWWLHYRADPLKRGVDYQPYGKARRGFPRKQWNQEFEIDFSVHSGTPFYPEYSDSLHMHNLKAMPGIPLILGFDFGLTPATVICQVSPTGHIIVVAEVVSEGVGITQHLMELIALLNADFPWWRKDMFAKFEEDELNIFREEVDMVSSLIDPAGFQRAQTDLTSPVQILRDQGFNPTGSIQDPVLRMEAVKFGLSQMHFYPKIDASLPMLLISDKCEVLLAGFRGGVKVGKNKRFTKDKNEYSHVMEALEYVLVKLIRPRLSEAYYATENDIIKPYNSRM